ncbi:MAG: helix-turn-helix transcriptional regulator [Dehalococcoidia bacterium]
MNRSVPLMLDFKDSAATDAGCQCDGGQPKNFARPCLLLLLAEGPAHGYELMERLRPFGFLTNDPATVYRGLRQMETEGLVNSRWDTSSKGAARRIYALTEDGSDVLAAWARALLQNRRILDHFQARYEQVTGQMVASSD